jgi:hypothetical protein
MGEDRYCQQALASVDFPDGSFIEVELFRKNNSIDVYFYHADEDNDRECPNIEDYIQDNLPDWSALMEEYEDAEVDMDEWQSHGFANEAAFWRWKEG